jgi:hypothetical protein
LRGEYNVIPEGKLIEAAFSALAGLGRVSINDESNIAERNSKIVFLFMSFPACLCRKLWRRVI